MKPILTALCGSHNYNLNTFDSDKDYKQFYLPTFDDLYNNRYVTSNNMISEDTDIDKHDVRKLSNLFWKANINFLEVLFSNKIISDQSEEISEIFAMKNDIARMNLPYLYNACKGMFHNKFNSLDKGTSGTKHLVELYGYDTKQALHSYRVLDFIVRFAETGFEDFKHAMTYSDKEKEFMMDIKFGELSIEDFENFVLRYYDESFIPLESSYKSKPTDERTKRKLEYLVYSLVKRNILKGDVEF